MITYTEWAFPNSVLLTYLPVMSNDKLRKLRTNKYTFLLFLEMNGNIFVFIAPAFSKVRYRGSTFRPFVRPSVRPSVHNLRRV